MNKYKNHLSGVIAFAILSSITSCNSNFLDEDLITQESTQSFETSEGLDKMSIGIYQNLEYHFAYTWAYTMQQYGTDEFSVGNDASEAAYNNYSSQLNSATTYKAGGEGIPHLWDNMYSGIATANTMIKNVPLYYDNTSSTYNNRLGEGHFFRGFNYFRLVSQYGGVPLITEPVVGAQTEFSRSTAEEVYAVIIDDLKKAYDNLPEKAERTGSATKAVAAHFLAKASLFRASEINDDWNSAYKNQDLQNVITYGEYVIGKNPLCNDFVELWDYKGANGANEYVSEVVFAAQFSDDATTYGRYGNQIHLYYPSIYQNLAGCKRDISGDREFSRMRTTNYSLDIFDRVNDSRFWKSFITTYRCNNPSGAPVWGDYAPEGKTAEDFKFEGGEIAIKYIVNSAGDTRYTNENINYQAPHTFVRYFSGETSTCLDDRGNFGSYSNKARFVALSKFRDGSRNSVASAFGQRDGILARSAEDYLMVAEAYGRMGQYDKALPYINAIRRRAGYYDGEDREKHVDGGQSYKTNSTIGIAGDGGSGLKNGFAIYCETNTYYESNNISETLTDDTKDRLVFGSVNEIFNSEYEFYTELGANSNDEKFMTFILNERSRELMGELMRWTDLSRTKQLEKRWKTFNDGSLQPEAAFDASKHYLRPIPQSFLDAITKDGKSLTPNQKQEMQNPNY